METPLSIRRVTRSQTRSQTLADSSINTKNNTEISKSEKTVTKSRQTSNQKGQDRSAFMDITNDSPIVGLAMGSLKTPSSTMSKKRINCQANNTSGTPGSGEALLRGQVKSLLQRVEEEAELSKITLEHKPFFNLVNSPICLVAPTPANTPQILSLGDGGNDLSSVTPSPVEDKFLIPQNQVLSEISDGEKDASESEKCVVTRSLLLEFFEKSDGSDSSVLTYQGGDGESSEVKLSTDDDDASIWSVQVNASSTRDDCEEEEEEEVEKECDYVYNFVDEEEDDRGLLDELCEGIIKMNMNGSRKTVKFTGKHTRFVYGSDDELEGEEVCSGEIESPVS